ERDGDGCETHQRPQSEAEEPQNYSQHEEYTACREEDLSLACNRFFVHCVIPFMMASGLRRTRRADGNRSAMPPPAATRMVRPRWRHRDPPTRNAQRDKPPR